MEVIVTNYGQSYELVLEESCHEKDFFGDNFVLCIKQNTRVSRYFWDAWFVSYCTKRTLREYKEGKIINFAKSLK